MLNEKNLKAAMFKSPFSVWFLKQRAVTKPYSGMVPDQDDMTTELTSRRIESLVGLAELAQRIKSDRDLFFSCSASADKGSWDHYFCVDRYKSLPNLTVELQALGAIAYQAGLMKASDSDRPDPTPKPSGGEPFEKPAGVPWYKRVKPFFRRRGDKGYDAGLGVKFGW